MHWLQPCLKLAWLHTITSNGTICGCFTFIPTWNLLFFSIIYTRLTRFEWLKRIILALIPVFILFSFFNSLFWENVTGFNSIQRHVEGSLIILYALAFMLETRKYFGNPWHESPYLIFSFGVLIYFSGSLFLFIFGRKMFSTGDDAYWALHGYLNIFLNLVFTAVILRSNAMPPKVK